MYKPEPRSITFDDTTVNVKMMDDSWIIDQCVSHSPFIPKQVPSWSHEDRCTRVQIPGDQFEDAMRSFREAYGNAAVIAWDGDVALGHIIFVPKAEARRWQMLHHERMPAAPDDAQTLVAQAVGFCSIGGQKYRGRGIGSAMAEMMIDWSSRNGWAKLEIYGVPSGLFPTHWMDSCMPPRPFWEKFGFTAIGRVPNGQTWDKIKTEQLSDDPRNNPAEMVLKRQIIDTIELSDLAEEDWAFDFDLEKHLEIR